MNAGLPGNTAAALRRIWDQIARHRSKIPWAVTGALALALWTPYAEMLDHHIALDHWFGLYIIAGSCLLAFVFWALIGTKSRGPMGWGMMLFWLSYCFIFWSADVSDLLAWRSPQALDAQATQNTWSGVLPARWGDWRYHVVGAPADSDPGRIIVVLRADPSDATKQKLRYQDATLMRAASGQAAAIGVDATYAGTSELDSLFCDLVQGVKPTPVTAYEMQRNVRLGFVRYPGFNGQPKCLHPRNQGQAMSLVDADNRIRGIPLYWEDRSGGSSDPAFSLKVAMDAGAKRPAHGNRFLRILRPPADSIDLRSDPADIAEMGQHPDFFGGKILIIGGTSPSDRFSTPFGAFPGAEIHAFAVFDLLHGYFLRRCPAILSAIIVFASCFTILLLWWRQRTVREMAAAAAALSVIILLLSGLLAHFFLLWVNVIFAIAAVWLLLPILWITAVRAEPPQRSSAS